MGNLHNLAAHSPAKRSIISVRRRLTLKLNSDIILFVVAFVVLRTIESELYILHISLIHCAKPICGTSSGAAQRVHSSRERERDSAPNKIAFLGARTKGD